MTPGRPISGHLSGLSANGAGVKTSDNNAHYEINNRQRFLPFAYSDCLGYHQLTSIDKEEKYVDQWINQQNKPRN